MLIDFTKDNIESVVVHSVFNQKNEYIITLNNNNGEGYKALSSLLSSDEKTFNAKISNTEDGIIYGIYVDKIEIVKNDNSYSNKYKIHCESILNNVFSNESVAFGFEDSENLYSILKTIQTKCKLDENIFNLSKNEEKYKLYTISNNVKVYWLNIESLGAFLTYLSCVILIDKLPLQMIEKNNGEIYFKPISELNKDCNEDYKNYTSIIELFNLNEYTYIPNSIINSVIQYSVIGDLLKNTGENIGFEITFKGNGNIYNKKNQAIKDISQLGLAIKNDFVDILERSKTLELSNCSCKVNSLIDNVNIGDIFKFKDDVLYLCLEKEKDLFNSNIEKIIFVDITDYYKE